MREIDGWEKDGSMRFAGIDMGSRTIEVVVLEAGETVESRQAHSGFDPLAEARRLLDGIPYDRIVATGYGRHLFEGSFQAPTVTEIKAYAVGARTLFPDVRTILDIGGQDSKAIAVNEAGKVVKFEMNDRCAAGTGKFLEIMAATLGYALEDFGGQAIAAKKETQINTMCTVFAESEVTSLLARGESREHIALGLHRSVVRRAAGMLKRVSVQEPILFAGGVARNPCMHRLMEEALGRKIMVPEDPQMVGALGAAWLAAGAG
jgi:predicted CoA-substrate-specific enzyme activase